MNEIVLMWADLLIVALAVLYLSTDFIANKPSNKIMMVIDEVLIMIVAVVFIALLYTIIIGTYQSTNFTVVFVITMTIMFLLLGRKFLQNLRETVKILQRREKKGEERI